MTVGRRAGIVTFVGLLAGGALLASLPFGVGGVRVGGVGLVWWFGVVAVPLAVGVVVLACRPLGGGAALLAAPVLVATIASCVFTGGQAGALVVAAALLPLALVGVGGSPSPASDRWSAAARLASAALIVWSQALLAADLARVAGGRRWHGLAAAAVALAIPPIAARGRAFVPAAGAALLVGGVVAGGAAIGVEPWTAWRTVASRPMLTFGAGSVWVADGAAILETSVLAFDEPQRVTARMPVTLRVLESDADGAAMREWRVGAGESVSVRPGDRLVAPAGAALRFEPGRRVPGAPLSGAAWADAPPAPADIVDYLGLALTLAGGLLAFGEDAGATGGARRGPPVAALIVILGAAAWGIYAILLGPDFGLAAPAVAPLVRLPRALGRPGMVAGALAAAGGVALWAALLAGLERWALPPRAGAQAPARRLAWLALALVATAAAAWRVDAVRAFVLGAGLAGTMLAAPALGAEGRLARTVAAGAGAVVFAAIAATAAIGAVAPALARYPALIAMPVAWAIARVAAQRSD
jgi:hypothetical protein